MPEEIVEHIEEQPSEFSETWGQFKVNWSPLKLIGILLVLYILISVIAFYRLSVMYPTPQ